MVGCVWALLGVGSFFSCTDDDFLGMYLAWHVSVFVHVFSKS